MKRLQIYLDEDLDERLAQDALRAGTSKAALIREAVATRYGRQGEERGLPLPDPLDAVVASIPGDAGDIDSLLYGPPGADQER
ncbi:MAG: CopG family transcriptional regulator [Candidatus Limnocylindrales bacterium]